MRGLAAVISVLVLGTACDERYTVLAVGDVANTNLANLGHLVLKANGLDTPELPGDVCVEAKPFPVVAVGDTFSIASPER